MIRPLIEHWNGTSWSVVPSPKLPKNSDLSAVTAPASNNVWALGVAGGSSDALVEHWDGTSWSIVPTPAGVNFIAGAAALSDGTVIAVGQGTNNSGVILHN
jgi:hypothetical protein